MKRMQQIGWSLAVLAAAALGAAVSGAADLRTGRGPRPVQYIDSREEPVAAQPQAQAQTRATAELAVANRGLLGPSRQQSSGVPRGTAREGGGLVNPLRTAEALPSGFAREGEQPVASSAVRPAALTSPAAQTERRNAPRGLPRFVGAMRTGRGHRLFRRASHAQRAEDGEGDLDATPPGGALPGDFLPEAESEILVEEWDHTWGLDAPCGCQACATCFGAWADVDFLLWWRSGRFVPPLASTEAIGTGVVLFGDDTLGDDLRPGGRVKGGFWMGPCEDWGVEARYWVLADQRLRFDSRDLPGVAVGRPIFDVEPPPNTTFNQEIVLPINGLGGATGFMTVESESNVFGGDVLLRKAFYRSPTARGDWLIGYQAARLDEDIDIRHSFSNTVDVFGRDTFDTRNEFHGAVVGLQIGVDYGCWMLDLLAKVGLGDMEHRVAIRGFEQLGNQQSNSGLLALGTNIGDYRRNQFAALPELGAQGRWQLCPNVDVRAGYSFLYWSDVVQAGDQIDRTVNGSQTSNNPLVGEPRPRFVMRTSSYWLHGFNLGLTWRF